MEDLLQPTEVIQFDEAKFDKNMVDHDWIHKKTNLKGSEDNGTND